MVFGELPHGPDRHLLGPLRHPSELESLDHRHGLNWGETKNCMQRFVQPRHAGLCKAATYTLRPRRGHQAQHEQE